MKKLRVVLFFLIPAAAFGQGAEPDTAAAFIGVALPETYVLRWVKDGKVFKKEAERRGFRVEVRTAGADQSLQNRQIRNYLDQGAQAVIIACINDSIGPVIAEAAQRNVVVIAYDRLIYDSADYDYYITYNQFEVGVLQAKSIEAELNLKTASTGYPKFITLFAGSPTDRAAYRFFDGAMSVLNPYIEEGLLRVIGPYPKNSTDTANFRRIATENWMGSIAKSRMESVLANEARDITLDAVLAPNDTLARAIIDACKTDDKYRFKLPVICGQDAEYDSFVSIRNGEQTGTVFKDTTRLAEAAVLLAEQILAGQTPSIPDAVLASGDLADIGDTGRKVVNTYLLDPTLITRRNLDVLLQAGFYD